MAAANARNQPIPTFTATFPFNVTAKKWLANAVCYFDGNTAAITRAQLTGFLSLAFSGNADVWLFDVEHHNSTALDNWENFSAAFTERFIADDDPEAARERELKALTMGHHEEIGLFFSRCRCASVRHAPQMPQPEGETEAQATLRKTWNDNQRNAAAAKYFFNGLLPVIKRRVTFLSTSTAENLLRDAKAAIKQLAMYGDYNPPAYASPFATAKGNVAATSTSKQPHAEEEETQQDAVVASIAAQLQSAGISSSTSAPNLARGIVQAVKTGKPLKPAKPAQKPAQQQQQGKERLYPDNAYTKGATCNYCGKRNHLEHQCRKKRWDANKKKNSTGASAVNALVAATGEAAAFSQEQPDFWV